MKKNILSLAVAASAALTLASCGRKPAAPQTAEGIVCDATMNRITLITAAGDTLSVSTMDADPAKVQGVLIDDSVKVTYLPVDRNGTQVFQAQELTVTARSPYFYIQGAWAEPNPIDSTATQGMRLNPDGTASSIGMATLQITGWNLADAKTLILNETSIGNKQTFNTTDTLTVAKLDADSLVLTNQTGCVMWRLGRQK